MMCVRYNTTPGVKIRTPFNLFVTRRCVFVREACVWGANVSVAKGGQPLYRAPSRGTNSLHYLPQLASIIHVTATKLYCLCPPPGGSSRGASCLVTVTKSLIDETKLGEQEDTPLSPHLMINLKRRRRRSFTFVLYTTVLNFRSIFSGC